MAGPAEADWVEVAAAIGPAELGALRTLLGFDGGDLALKASSVHTVRGDEILPARRRSASVTGRSAAVFDYLSENVLPRLQPAFLGRSLEIVCNHYDVVSYAPGGFFAPHVDHVPCRAPSIAIWHGLLCLEAEGCEGGCTAVYGPERAPPRVCLTATRTPGSVALLRQDVRHAGLMVTSGRKVVLKFDVLELRPFLPPPAGAPLDSVSAVCLECLDGDLWLDRAVLLKLEYFRRHLAFEGDPRRTRLGLSRGECLALYLYLAGRDEAGVATVATEAVHDLLEYMGAEEAALPAAAFEALWGVRRPLLTASPEWAALFGDLAVRHPSLSLFIVLQRHEQSELGAEDVACPYEALLLDARGAPLLDTGGRWLFQRPGVVDRKRLLTRYSAGPSVLSSEELAAAGSDVSAVARGVVEAFVRRRLQPYVDAGGECGGGGAPRPVLGEAQGRALARAALYDSVGRRRRLVIREQVAARRTDHREEEEYCNDGDSYSVSYYVTTSFFVEWLLWPGPLNGPPEGGGASLSPAVLEAEGCGRYDGEAEEQTDDADDFVGSEGVSLLAPFALVAAERGYNEEEQRPGSGRADDEERSRGPAPLPRPPRPLAEAVAEHEGHGAEGDAEESRGGGRRGTFGQA